MNQPDLRAASLTSALSEPYAYIVLQWPALLGALALDSDGWPSITRIALFVLVALLQISAWRRGGAGFGNAMFAATLCAATAWQLYPSAWAIAPWSGALLLILVAQMATLRRIQLAAR